MSKHLKNIGVVAMLTMVSRVLGMVSLVLQSRVFGAGLLASAFTAAFRIPNLFRRLLAEGAFTAAFVPTLQEELHHRKEEGAFRLVNQAASWLLLASGSVVVVALLLAWVTQQAIDGWILFPDHRNVAERWTTALRLEYILFPYLIFVCLAAAFSAALQSLNRFVEPALSPIWLNLSMIGALGGAFWGGWAGGDLGQCMRWLCAGTLLGGFLQMAVPAGALAARGWRPQLDFRADAPVRQIARLMAPTVLGSAIYLINMTVSQQLALSVSDQAGALLNYATRVMELPIGVFAIAISTVVFPLISKHAAAGNWEHLASAYRKGMRLTLVVNVPAAVGLAILARPVVRVLFQGGAFEPRNTNELTPILVVFAVGLPFLAAVSLILRAFYSRKDTSTPVRAGAWSFAVNLVLSVALMWRLGALGLAISSTVAVIVQAAYLQSRLVRQSPGLAFRNIAGDVGKIALASAIMGAAVWEGAVAWESRNPVSKLADISQLALLIGGGAALYGGLLWVLHIEGRKDLAGMLEKFRGRK